MSIMFKTSFKFYLALIIFVTISAVCSTNVKAQQDKAVEDSLTKLMKTQKGGAEDLRVPFGVMDEKRVTGSITKINTDELLRYDNSQGVLNALNGRVPGLMFDSNIRGLGSALVVVNGVPRPAGILNLQEVESVSVLRGATASVLYGTQASNGVILIETKKGKAGDFQRKVIAEYGVGDPISYPNYLGSAQYMRLYNEALQNDGLPARYDQDLIENHENSNNSLRYPDQHYLNDTYLRDYRPFTNIFADFRGGNQTTRYYLNMGYERNGTLIDLGEGKDEKNELFHLRGRVDIDVNDVVKPFLETRIYFNENHNSNSQFWGDVTSSGTRPHLFKARIDADNLSEDMRAGARLIDGKYVAGGTNQYQNNPYANLKQAGYNDRTNRRLQFNTGIDFDLTQFVSGLNFRTNISFDIYNNWTESISNGYAVYEPNIVTTGTGSDSLTFNKIGRWDPEDSPSSFGENYERRLGFFGVMDYNPELSKPHDLNLTGLVYADRTTDDEQSWSLQNPEAHHFGLRANYMYMGKYVAEVATAYSGSARLPDNTKWSLSPSVGAAWIISEESFMKDSPVFDYLKLNASWGILKSDRNFGYRLYESTFNRTGFYSFGDGTFNNNGTEINSIENPNLEYEKHRQMEIGLNAEVLDNSLAIYAAVFHEKHYDQVTRPLNQFPAYLANNVAYDNYGTDEYQGIELGLNYQETFGDWKLGLGGSFVYATSEVVKLDEPRFEDEYLSQVGKPTDAIFGYVAQGLFQDSSEIENHATQQFGEVRPGDIKYKDLNGDGIINENDQRHIGNWGDRIQYGIQLNVGYKNFNLFILGTGRNGSESMFNSDYYWVDGNDKYSEEVLDRWTPNNRDASYPRLTSQSASNNYRTSTFWLEEVNTFSINRLQLSYNLELEGNNIFSSTGLQVYLQANNVLTISNVRDKLNLNVGGPPQMRNYSAGIKLSFN